MVDQPLAREAIALLSTAIAEIFEDANPAAIADLRGAGLLARAREIEAVGADVAVLAAAIGVLARRSGTSK